MLSHSPLQNNSACAISLLIIQEKAGLLKEELPYHAYYFNKYVKFQAFLNNPNSTHNVGAIFKQNAFS